MSLRSVRSLPQMRRTLHSSSSAPNPSHLLSTQQSASRSHFNSFTVQKLKTECKSRGLRQNGRKNELVDRILGFEQAQSFSSTARPAQPAKPLTAKPKPVAAKPAPVAPQAIKQFTTSAPVESPEKVDGVSVPQPPSKNKDVHPVTKIPIKFDVDAATPTAQYGGRPRAGDTGLSKQNFGSRIHVVDSAKTRVSAMNTDTGDGYHDIPDNAVVENPLPRQDKRLLSSLGAAIAAWFLLDDFSFTSSDSE